LGNDATVHSTVFIAVCPDSVLRSLSGVSLELYWRGFALDSIVDCNKYKFNALHYADGYVLKDWFKKNTIDVEALPKTPDPLEFWTYRTCKKNTKGVQFINLIGDCPAYQKL